MAAYFNIDGKLDVNEPEEIFPKFTEPLRVELVRHRCWVHVDHGAGDSWPYDYRYVEQLE